MLCGASWMMGHLADIERSHTSFIDSTTLFYNVLVETLFCSCQEKKITFISIFYTNFSIRY